MKLPTYDVAVIGAGFTGSALAVQLAEAMPAGSKILLLGAPKATAKGVAYGTDRAAPSSQCPRRPDEHAPRRSLALRPVAAGRRARAGRRRRPRSRRPTSRAWSTGATCSNACTRRSATRRAGCRSTSSRAPRRRSSSGTVCTRSGRRPASAMRRGSRGALPRAWPAGVPDSGRVHRSRGARADDRRPLVGRADREHRA